MHVRIQVIELQVHACPIPMHGPNLVFLKRRCLHKVYYGYFLCIIKVYHLTRFQVLMYSGVIREVNQKMMNNAEIIL